MHVAAKQGYAKAAGTYSTGRPGYPAEVGGWITQTLSIGPGVKVLDLGAGTGKFTKLLAETGADIIAADPVPEMLAELKATLPNVETLVAQAERLPLPDASVDVITCAQCFHWFANEHAVAEITRVLKPGGLWGLIWNSRDQRTDWVAALTRIMEPYEAGVPRHDKGEWRALFPAPGFTDLTEQLFAYGHTGPAEQVIIDRIMSVSFIAALPKAEAAKVRGQIKALIEKTPALRGQAEVTFPYVTKAYWCRKI